MASVSSNPRTVEDIFKDFNARRNAVIRALTSDVDGFYSLCDPDKDNLCLYGHPNDTWEVALPAEEVPPELPEPALGINFARDVFEVVTERKPLKDKPGIDSGSKSRSSKRSSDSQTKGNPRLTDESYVEDEDEHGETLCGSCGANYSADEFWICCDICERWFHGKCVRITPAKAEHIKQYKCPSCSTKKIRA